MTPPADKDPDSPGAAPSQGAALRYLVGSLADIRAKAGDGKFASLLFLAYAIVTLQVLGLAHYDLTRAISILDAASLTNLLLVVPAVTLLPVVGYVVAASAFCFAIGKVGVYRESSRRVSRASVPVRADVGFSARWAARLSAFREQPFGIAAYLAVLAALPFAAAVVLFVLPVTAAIVTLGCFVAFLLPGGDSDEGFAASARHFTDIWSLTAAMVSEVRYESSAARRRVGFLLGGFLVTVALAAVYPRPWMPARVVVLSTPVAKSGLLASCADGQVSALVATLETKAFRGTWWAPSRSTSPCCRSIETACCASAKTKLRMSSFAGRGSRSSNARPGIS